jgi:dihydrofolate synthase / folylpolyglutamate synthase
MHFDDAVRYLLSLGHETLTVKLGLKNTELLLRELQNPETNFRAVQIAGTNGKGSTAAMLDSICRCAGIRIGLYTSPHLVSITERIKIAGVDLSQEEFALHATTVRDAATQLVDSGQLQVLPTFFEQVTAIALVAFRHSGVELAILETGLGGRLDSTTATNADVCAITQIAFDHEEYLGDTIEKIAAEKAAIIRPGVKAVIAQQSPEARAVILKRCEEVGVTPLVDSCETTIKEVSRHGRFRVTFDTTSAVYDNLWLGIRGSHQIENACTSIVLAEVLGSSGFQIDHTAIVRGILTANHPGRLELISGEPSVLPSVLLDGAHNPAGARALRQFLTEFAERPLTLVFGAMRDKRLEQIAEELFPIADELILTPIRNPRAASTEALLEIAQRFEKQRVSVATSSGEALELALDKTTNKGTVCVTGSLYLIGELRDRVLQMDNSELQETT